MMRSFLNQTNISTSVAVMLLASVLLGGKLCADDVSFSEDIRPILSDHCFACHGPDEADRQANLRLDNADGIAAVVDADNLAISELLARIQSDDPDTVMPPPDFHKPLTREQKDALQAWVAAGATFTKHWSFEVPKKSASTPNLGAIDWFVDRKVQSAGLTPTEVADRRTLLRRVCLDLTGLPPSREQMDEFLGDTSPHAYENLVDRLIGSQHYGQHMARHWLDLVRYGDTHGLHLDNYREMWLYRDWVVDAFIDNMPMDQFMKEQLAGDLLPDATQSQQIASGFNRLNVTTNEGGSIYDEVFARNVIDRTDAFGVVFLGLTTGCAVCHDHKFDPITQRDYYSLSAFFNNLDGRAMDENVEDPSPVLKVASPSQSEQLAAYRNELGEVQRRMQGQIDTVDAAQAAWESALVSGEGAAPVVLEPTSVVSSAKKKMQVRDDHSVELVEAAASTDTTTITATLPEGSQWQTLHLQALTETPDGRVGASKNGNVVLTEIVVETRSPEASQDEWLPVPIKHAIADVEQANGPFAVRFAFDEKEGKDEGWAVGGHESTGPRNAWFVVPSLMVDAETPGTEIRVQLKYLSKYASHQFQRIRLAVGQQGPMVPDGQQITFGDLHSAGPFPVESASPGYGRKFASQGKEFKPKQVFRYQDQDYRWRHRDDLPPVALGDLPTLVDRATVTMLHQNVHAPRAQQATLLLDTDDGHVIYLNGKKVHERRGPAELKPLENEYTLDLKAGDNRLYIKVVNHRGESRISYAWRSPAIRVPSELVELLRTPTADRDADQQAVLQKYYRSVYCLHPDWLALTDQRKGFQTSLTKLQKELPTTLVWKERKKPREARILLRGQYDQPGEVVPRATPSFLPEIECASDDAPSRLDLARWLCAPENPLPARVAVNRFWQQIFGTGLVKTSEDFGNQGQSPSHPELLDFLAVEFRDSGWDVASLIKSMVMSDAYRRSSSATKQQVAADPGNRWLARGPRYRLDAEVLRDQSLALSGLLNDELGGPSVKPPQPDGLWYAVGYTRSNTAKFTADTEEQKIYRRSVYTFWKRTSPPPQMTTFDAPSRESCTARRERTNTPLQALLLMNETQYLHAAKSLAQRVLDHPELKTDEHKVDWLFETITIRQPSELESSELVGLLNDLTEHYREKAADAAKLVGEESATKAAWMVVASTLLNLDEVVSK